MRIAFLMQCHKNSEHINLLLDALNHPMVDVFVHVDKKSQEIRNRITQRKGVYILPEQQCVDVQWAQYSQVEASLRLLDAAVNGGGVRLLLADKRTGFSSSFGRQNCGVFGSSSR